MNIGMLTIEDSGRGNIAVTAGRGATVTADIATTNLTASAEPKTAQNSKERARLKRCPQGVRRAEIAHKYVHAISEARSRLVCVAHEDPRSLTLPNQEFDDPRSYVSCCAGDEICHRKLLYVVLGLLICLKKPTMPS